MLESVVMPHDCVAMHRPVAGLRQGRRRERNIMVEIQKIVEWKRTQGLFESSLMLPDAIGQRAVDIEHYHRFF